MSTLLGVITSLLLVAQPEPGHAIKPDPLRYVAPGRDFDNIHTALDLDLDLADRRIAGSVTHTLKSLRPGLDHISLNCVDLVVDSVTVNGAAARFDYPVRGDRTTTWISAAAIYDSDNRLVVYPGVPVDRGLEFTVTVYYHGQPQKGLYWIRPEKGLPDKRPEVWSQGEGEENRYWIPCHDYPDDRATFEGRFRVERGIYVLSNGTLIEQREVGGKSEYHWKIDQPIVSYLIMIAAAEYRVREDEWNGLPLLYVVPPGTDDATIDRTYAVTSDVMEYFTRVVGAPYPFSKYAQVVVQNFIYSGMENASATTMTMRTLYEEHEGLTRDEQGLVAHELAHQWWGDLLTCREWSHIWLNEGFSTYYQKLFRGEHDGDDAMSYAMMDSHRKTTVLDDTGARPLVVDFYNRQDATNSTNVYNKGASVLHMLRYIIGDELFHAAMQHYAQKNAFGLVDTGDFVAAVRDVTGQNLDWFFEQWVYLAGHPKFHVRKHWNADARVLEIDVEQKQEVDGLVPVFRTPVDIEITCGDHVELHRVMIEGASEHFVFALPANPDMVIFDKGDWILKTLDFPKLAGELIYQLEHGDYMSRVYAAVALGKARDDAGAPGALRAAMSGEGHWGLRREAALAMGELGTREARSILIEGLNDDEARVRLACAEALGSFRRDEEAARALRACYDRDRSDYVRSAAVGSLVGMRATTATEVCTDALRRDSHRSTIRVAGLKGLSLLRATDTMKKIAPMCGPGNDRTYRHEAIKAYARLARELERKSAREDAARAVAGSLDDWYLKTRLATIEALELLGEEVAVPDLRRAATKDPVVELRARAALAADRIEARADRSDTRFDAEAKLDELERRMDDIDGKIRDIQRDSAK